MSWAEQEVCTTDFEVNYLTICVNNFEITENYMPLSNNVQFLTNRMIIKAVSDISGFYNAH